MAAGESGPPPADANRPWVWQRWSLRGALRRGCLYGLSLVLILELGNHLLAGNVHTVLPGLVYRCAQPSGKRLDSLIQRYGIRTVVNLRGFRESQEWFRDECRAAHLHGVSIEDVALSAGRLPAIHEIQRLVEILDHCEYPVLFHCYRGVDRTGLASAIARILRTDCTLDEARSALSLRYIHLPFGRTGNLDLFFELYEQWLVETELEHSATAFRTWVKEGYRGGACNGTVELRGPLLVGPERQVWRETPTKPAGITFPWMVQAPRGVPFVLPVRCHNKATLPWRFHPNSTAGVHVHWFLMDTNERCIDSGRAGLLDALVPPGGTIDLDVALPALRFSGKYLLQITMMEEQHCYFHQVASQPLDLELEVP